MVDSDDFDAEAAIDGLQALIDDDDFSELSDALGIEEDQCLPLVLFFIQALEGFDEVMLPIGQQEQL